MQVQPLISMLFRAPFFTIRFGCLDARAGVRRAPRYGRWHINYYIYFLLPAALIRRGVSLDG